MKDDYELLDSGRGRKLERFGEYVLARPSAQAVWSPQQAGLWDKADASFDREKGLHWRGRERLPESWVTEIAGVKMRLSSTDFGHLGVFPETRALWLWLKQALGQGAQVLGRQPKFLNLFAYSGGATLAAAQAGAACCHLDASKGMVQWARENAELNGLKDAPIRWIVDDVMKFLQRELKRGVCYDGVLLDPPSFGRGSKGELYKVEEALLGTVDAVRSVLSQDALFVVLTSHTPGFTPTVLTNILAEFMPKGGLQGAEMLLTGAAGVRPLPSGASGTWMSPALAKALQGNQ